MEKYEYQIVFSDGITVYLMGHNIQDVINQIPEHNYDLVTSVERLSQKEESPKTYKIWFCDSVGNKFDTFEKGSDIWEAMEVAQHRVISNGLTDSNIIKVETVKDKEKNNEKV